MARVEIDETVLRTAGGGALVPAAGASVRVYLRDTTTNAAVYVAETGGSTRAQPLSTDANGRIDGWVDEGSYDLAVSIGGTLMYTQPWEAWRPTSVRAFGATGDPAQDATTQLVAALAATAGGTLYIPDGTYTFATNALLVPSNTRVVASPGAIFKPSGTVGHPVAIGNTAPSTYKSLTVNATEGAQTVTMSSSDAATFTASDMVVIRDDFDLNGVQAHQEPNIVESVAGGVVTFKWPLNFSYQTSLTARVGKVPTASINAHWQGGIFDLTGVPDDLSGLDHNAFNISCGIGCTVRDVKCQSWPSKVVATSYSLGCSIENIVGLAPSSPLPGNGYVAATGWSRDTTIRNIWGRNTRHVADVGGGSDHLLQNIHGVGRTTDTTCVALLHGLHSKRVKVDGVFGENVDTVFGAGNVTFGADYDFEATGIEGVGCDLDVSVTQGCTFRMVQAKARKSIKRAALFTDVDGVIDIDSDTVTNSAFGYAAVVVSGVSKLAGKVRVRGAPLQSVSLTGTLRADLDLDLEQPAAATSHAVIGSSLDATSVVKLKGRIDTQDAAKTTVDAINITAPSGAQVITDLEVSGVGRRGLCFAGGSIVQIVRGRNRGDFADQLHADAGELEIPSYDFSASGSNCVSMVSPAAKVTFGRDIRWRGTQTRLSNTAAAAIVGGEATQTGQLASQGWADGSATLNAYANPQQVIATTPLTANRAVALGTFNALPGARFRITRTAASTGAFTLDVGTGPLKSLATSQWCEVMYSNSGAWTLIAFGSL